MSRISSVTAAKLFSILFMPLLLCPQLASAQAIHQDTISTSSPPAPPCPVGGTCDHDPAEDNQERPYLIPLTYITPDFFRGELDSALVPGDGMAILKRGEVARNMFKIEGVEAVIPNQRTHGILVYGTTDGFNMVKSLILALDVPARRTPQLPDDNAPQPNLIASATFPKHLYQLILAHTTPDFILPALDAAFLTSRGVAILKPGETARNVFAGEWGATHHPEPAGRHPDASTPHRAASTP